MSASSIETALPSSCKVTIPTLSSQIHEIIPRWSDAVVSLPYAVVTPSHEGDIFTIIKYAVENDLKVVPTGGGHGCFVPITDRTIYLDLQKFDSIEMDEEKGEVRIGGGTKVGPVLKTLAAKGWYTCAANSNALGFVGSLLGGLNHSTGGMHGPGIDFIQEIRIIPFSLQNGALPTRALELTPSSSGEEKKLFDTIRGAGHGLGIITGVTLKTHRISSLNLSEDKLWTRRLIFAPANLDIAISLYLSLLPLSDRLTQSLVFLRLPPGAPQGGGPVLMFSMTYFGPKEEAEKACAATFSEEVVSRAAIAVTDMKEWSTINDAFEPINRHGGFKEYHSAFLYSISPESIQQLFQSWLDYSARDIIGNGGSYVVISASNAANSVASGKGRDLFPVRDRPIFVQVSPWYPRAEGKAEADAFGRDVLKAVREQDRSAGNRDMGFANNLLAGQDMLQVYEEAQIEEIQKAKRVWDATSVGWSPVIDGW